MQPESGSPSPGAAPAVFRWERIRAPLLIIILLGVILRIYKLDYQGYWDDEMVSHNVARAAALDIIRSLGDYDVHLPGYYLLLHFWRIFGDDLTTLRLFSVVLSSACMLLVYLLGRQLIGRPAALAAAGIMALSPFQVFHGQQARMYPLLTLLTLAAVMLFVQAWRHGGWPRWLAFGLCVAIGCYTHIYFLFSLLALDLWALYETYQQRHINRARWAGLLLAQVLGGLTFVQFLPQLLGTVGSVQGWYWINNTPLDGLFALLSLSNHATLAFVDETPRWYLVLTFVPGVAVLLLAFVYSIREARRHPAERSTWLLLHCLIWVPLIVATTIALTIKPILLDRYLIGISGPLYLLMGWMLVRFWQQRAVRVLAVVYVLSCGASLAYAYPDARQQSALIEMADYMRAIQAPGTAVAYTDWQSFDAAMLRYHNQPDVFVVPGPSSWTDEHYWNRRVAFMRWEQPPRVQPIAEFAPHYQRVALALTRYNPDLLYQRDVSLAWLEQHGRLIERADFGRAVVFYYETGASAPAPEAGQPDQ